MREDQGRCGPCGSYLKSILKFLVSHIGLVSLVVGYTIIGAFTFAKLEAEHEVEVKKNMSSVREKVTDRLWDMTNEMACLEEVEWSDRARDTLRDFEKSLIRAIKQDGWDGIESDEPKQWTFAGALFYSIILITTIGYGHIAPKTPWGKVVTIFYAIPGVPLMMLCLANIGDGMAHSFRFLYWKVCCYACTKKPKKKRRTKSTTRMSRSSQHGGGPGTPRAPHPRSSSFRRSARNSQRSADSQYSDSAFCSYSEPDYRLSEQDRDLGDGLQGGRGLGARGGDRGGPPPSRGEEFAGARDSGRGARSSDRSNATRTSQTSKQSSDPREQEDGRAAVLFNKYALEKEGLDQTDESGSHLPLPSQHRGSDRSNASKDHYGSGRSKGGADMAVVDREPRMRNTSPGGTPTLGRSLPRDHSTGRPQYPQHLPPPHDPRLMPPRLDPPYVDDVDSDEFDDGTDYEGDPGDKPVPIWLGVMLVVAYILGGAVLFSGWENWEFLDSVYFCFITLTTIGFGDFVPAQEKKENAELSIALCSLYLLFGIALLAMSFNLVQEEVISNVKSVAKRLGIIKEEDVETMQD